MMTHKEALRVAQNAFFMHRPCNMEVAIRTYIEARGLVLVPSPILYFKSNAHA